MTLQATYLGAASIGVTDLNPDAALVYTIPITLAADGWLVAIEAAWHAEPGQVDTSQLNAAIYADDADAPGTLLALSARPGSSATLNDTDRWVAFPLGVWLTAGDYHVGTMSGVGAGSARLRITTGGASGDGHTVSGAVSTVPTDGDYASATVTATTSIYSIRGVVITESGGPTPPTPSGNRMGGTGAIRKSPRGRSGRS